MKPQNLFERYNQKYFDGVLSRYPLIISDRFGGDGMCRRTKREIHVNNYLNGKKFREVLIHEMAHATSNGGHGSCWLTEMRRVRALGAPTGRDVSIYEKSNVITQGKDGLIGMMEDAGIEIGDASKWSSIRQSEGYSYGLVDKYGKAESKSARRLLHKMRLAFLRGVRDRISLNRAEAKLRLAFKGDRYAR